MIETRIFDYKGFHSKKAYLKNKLKSIIGKGESEKDILIRRKKLIDYYKLNPHKLKEKGKSESKESFEKKLKGQSGSIVSRRSNKVTSEIRKTGSKYTPGQMSKYAGMASAPLALAPIPGTTTAAGVVIAGGSLLDKTKMAWLKHRHKGIKKADESYQNLKKNIDSEDKIQMHQNLIKQRS